MYTSVGSKFVHGPVSPGTGKVWYKMEWICILDANLCAGGVGAWLRRARSLFCTGATTPVRLQTAGEVAKLATAEALATISGPEGVEASGNYAGTGRVLSRWDRPSRGDPADRPAGCPPGCHTWPGRRGRFCLRSGSWTGRGRPAHPRGR